MVQLQLLQQACPLPLPLLRGSKPSISRLHRGSAALHSWQRRTPGTCRGRPSGASVARGGAICPGQRGQAGVRDANAEGEGQGAQEGQAAQLGKPSICASSR